MSGAGIARAALAEIAAVTDAVDAAALERACALIAGAGRVVLHGCGREALQVRGFAMRLHHLGLSVGVVGETTAPPVGLGDVFVVSDGPGRLATTAALAALARQADASVLVITAEPDAPIARAAECLLVLPARTMARGEEAGALPMGSVYEGALFVVFEVLVAMLRSRLEVDVAAMRARHTNLE